MINTKIGYVVQVVLHNSLTDDNAISVHIVIIIHTRKEKLFIYAQRSSLVLAVL